MRAVGFPDSLFPSRLCIFSFWACLGVIGIEVHAAHCLKASIIQPDVWAR